MGLKGWFENKLALRKAEQEQRKQEGKIAKNYQAHRTSNHDASKKGHRHQHGAGFVTKFVKDKITTYKHGRTYGKTILSNHQRVFAKRLTSDPRYSWMRQ